MNTIVTLSSAVAAIVLMLLVAGNYGGTVDYMARNEAAFDACSAPKSTNVRDFVSCEASFLSEKSRSLSVK